MPNDFSKGKIWKIIVAQAVPLTLAQIVQLFYNIVDRIYIGHLSGVDGAALAGVGLTFPVIALIGAFTSLFGTGGSTLFAIVRGAKEDKKAELIIGNVFFLLSVCSIILFAFVFLFCRQILYLFGASNNSYIYAGAYMKIYLFGTSFSMLSAGLNGFINAQGFPKTGMLTTVLGAALNLILDPLFIFAFHMGVGGAALATVISQAVSAVWVLRFLVGKKALLRLKRENIHVDWKCTKDIIAIGISGFVMQSTTSLVQVFYNKTLLTYGGDLYVGIMAVLTSVRDLTTLTVQGLNNGAQPVMGYNYGAGENQRVKEGIRFSIVAGFVYTSVIWLLVSCFPREIMGLFSGEDTLIEAGIPGLKIFFFAFFFLAFHMAGQTVFLALGQAKKAVFFSMLRKVMLVIPLVLLLPRLGLGVNGVFMSEPLANFTAGLICFVTMWRTVYQKLDEKNENKA